MDAIALVDDGRSGEQSLDVHHPHAKGDHSEDSTQKEADSAMPDNVTKTVKMPSMASASLYVILFCFSIIMI
jgi:hypothetical protein